MNKKISTIKTKKWRLFLAVSMLVAVTLAVIINNYNISGKANSYQDHLYTIEEDLDALSGGLKYSGITYKQLKTSLEKKKESFNFDDTNKIISFQMISIYFNDENIIDSIKY